MSKLLNFLNTEVKCVISTVIVSEPLVKERNESIQHEILQQRYAHVCATTGLEHTDYLIEVLYDLRCSLWAAVSTESVQCALVDSVVVRAILESHVQGVHHLVVNVFDLAILHMLDNLLFKIDAY